jgi:hypothetical protein
MPSNHVVVKLDFSNAFNNIHRDVVLSSVANLLPNIYRFFHLSYDKSTLLKFSNSIIISQEGVQQGDPLGPLGFCLAIHSLIMSCKSDLKIAYMDDVTLGGPATVVAADVVMIKEAGAPQGLFLNDTKCEAITSNGQTTIDPLHEFIQFTPSSATLLGAPLSVGPAMDMCLSKRCDELELASSRLEVIEAHDALVLLRASFNAPKLQHLLRASPCSGHTLLSKFDMLLRAALSKICNVNLSDDQWLQASLPVRSGGLGVRRVSSLATPAFIASAVGTSNLQEQILHTDSSIPDTILDEYQQSWHAQYGQISVHSAPAKQQAWDRPIVDLELSQLIARQNNDYDKARLLAASSKHSGDWLHVIPISSCGLRLDNNAVRIAVGLRLGVDICEPHLCVCGAMVDVRGSHALSCKRTSGRLIRHNYLNDIILRSLNRASIPATKEPVGLFRSDGKKPDGLTLIPWKEGRCLVWDVTVADTTAVSYVSSTSIASGSAAEQAATRKLTKYADLCRRYEFVPIALESHGPFCASATTFLTELGRRIAAVTFDTRETSFLYQRLSIALQRFNAVCVMNTFVNASDGVFDYL